MTATSVKHQNPHDAPLLLACVLAWAGTAISGLLSAIHSGGSSPLCLADSGCNVLLASRYARLAGVPLAWVGLAYYSLLLAALLTAFGTSAHGRRLRLLSRSRGLALVGAAFSGILMVVQFFIVRAFCPLCTASAIVAVALAGCIQVTERRAATMAIPGHRPAALTLAFFCIIGITAFLLRAAPGERRMLLADLSLANLAGPDGAKARLVVFSDFQCPHCAKVADVLKRVRREFPDSVQVAHMYLPLPGHPLAFEAAVAAECAAEQGAFWEFYDRLHALKGKLNEDTYLVLARELRLDEGRFQKCRTSGLAAARVRASLTEATTMGIEGVPALFLNGRAIRSPGDYDSVATALHDVLHDHGTTAN